MGGQLTPQCLLLALRGGFGDIRVNSKQANES
jgi:hypothetical protein